MNSGTRGLRGALESVVTVADLRPLLEPGVARRGVNSKDNLKRFNLNSMRRTCPLTWSLPPSNNYSRTSVWFSGWRFR